MSNINTVDFASALSTLSLSDLTGVCGGGDNPTPASSSTSTTTVNPKLECPDGTSPSWVRATGDLAAQMAGGLGAKGNGSGSFEQFKCVPVTPPPTTPNQG
jgi:hypothetical protein